MFIYETSKKKRYYRKVVSLYQKTGYSPYYLAKVFPLSRKTIERWIANFVAGNPQSASMKRVKSIKNPQVQPSVHQQDCLPRDVRELQSELKDLRAQLKRAEIKAEAYEELINVAESRFNIQIRKKAGAKQ